MAIVNTFGRVRTSKFEPKPTHARIQTIRHRCPQTGLVREGLPDFDFQLPGPVADMTDAQRRRWVKAGSDFCSIDRSGWYIRCTMTRQLIGVRGRFGYGVWVEVSADDFKCYGDNIDLVLGSHLGPFSGRLANRMPDMADTIGLSCRVHLSDDGRRPNVELLACAHPFYEEQQRGVAVERAITLAELVPGFQLAVDA